MRENQRTNEQVEAQMNIIYIKAGFINEASGGGLEARKIWNALEKTASRHPDCAVTRFSADAETSDIRTLMARTPFKDRLSRALLHSSYVYVNWWLGRLNKVLMAQSPDVVILGNSRLGFMARWLRTHAPDVRLICHYDNVEADYVGAAWGKAKGPVDRLLKHIEGFCVRRDERDAVRYAHDHLVLTQRDQHRLGTLYNQPGGSVQVLPICLNEPAPMQLGYGTGPVQLLFLGSLWYGSNQEAVCWFLDQVWPAIRTRYPDARMTVAGSRPPEGFKKQVTDVPGIRLVPDFDRLEDVLLADTIVVAPIRTGAGMKVKVAESLSLGLPVIASEEALVGYGEAREDPLSETVLFPAETAADYLAALVCLAGRDVDETGSRAKRLFRRYYSWSRSEAMVEALLFPPCEEPSGRRDCVEAGD